MGGVGNGCPMTGVAIFSMTKVAIIFNDWEAHSLQITAFKYDAPQFMMWSFYDKFIIC